MYNKTQSNTTMGVTIKTSLLRFAMSQIMDVDEDSGENVDIQSNWIRQHGRQDDILAHIR